MSNNIANTLMHADPGFFWIIPDDDHINKSEFVKVLEFLTAADADLVNFPYCTISEPSKIVYNDPFFLQQQVEKLNPPFMLLSSLAFRFHSKTDIGHAIDILQGSHNMYAQNLLLTILPPLRELTICTLNISPVIYNNYALPRFSSANGVADACDIILELSRIYGFNTGLTSRALSKILLNRNLRSTISIVVKNPTRAWASKEYYRDEFRLFAKSCKSLGLYPQAFVCMFIAFFYSLVVP